MRKYRFPNVKLVGDITSGSNGVYFVYAEGAISNSARLRGFAHYRWPLYGLKLIVLCLVSILMPLPLLAQTPAEGTSVVMNGDFEAGEDGWYVMGGNLPPESQQFIRTEFLTKGSARSGKYAAGIANHGAIGIVGIAQSLELPPASKYTLSYHYRMYMEPGLCWEASALVLLTVGTEQIVAGQHSICDDDALANWLPYEVDITPLIEPNTPYTLSFEVWTSSESFVIFYVDDVSIAVDDHTPTLPLITGNVIANGSFEKFTSDWSFYHNGVEAPELLIQDYGRAYSGAYLLELPVATGLPPDNPNNYAIVQESVTIPAGRDVTLTFSYLLEEDNTISCTSYYGLSILVGIQPLAGGDEVLLEAVRNCGPNEAGWHTANIDLNGYQGQNVRLTIHVQSVIPFFRSRTIYLDDIAIDLEYKPVVLTPSDLQARRLAAEFLASIQHDGEFEEWHTATLAPSSRPLFRPGVSGVAFYEFQVVSGTVPAGYIMAATGPHDFPIFSWDRTGLPPTYMLEDSSYSDDLWGEMRAYMPMAKYYVFDVLSLAAEDKWGKLLTPMARLPLKVTGYPADWLDSDYVVAAAAQAISVTTVGDVEQVQGVEQFYTDEEANFELDLVAWDDWDELKSSYHIFHALPLAERRETVAEEWEQINLFALNGRDLYVGIPYTLSLLSDGQPTISLQGAGSDGAYLSTQIIETPGQLSTLVLTALQSKPDEGLPVQVGITYGDGSSETHLFYIIPDAHLLHLPSIRTIPDASSPDLVSVAMVEQTTISRAGKESEQPRYIQMPPSFSGTNPNKRCYSGCSPTAMTMLFGWVDYQAGNGNARWKLRHGLLRDPLTGNDIVAPLNMSSYAKTPEIFEMMLNLNEMMGTFCEGDEGATYSFYGDWTAKTDFTGAIQWLRGCTVGDNYKISCPAVDDYDAYRSYVPMSVCWDLNQKGGNPTVLNEAINSIKLMQTPVYAGTWMEGGHTVLVFEHHPQSNRVKETACVLRILGKCVEKSVVSDRTVITHFFRVNTGWDEPRFATIHGNEIDSVIRIYDKYSEMERTSSCYGKKS